MWNLGPFFIVDKVTKHYKGTYNCLSIEYMPKKLQNWSIKVGRLANSKHKYVHDFNIHWGRNGGNGGNDGVQPARRDEQNIMHNIVMKFMEDNHGKEHCIIVYF
jgi:hypothetical protein